jgi:hypothetical protein
MSKFNIYKARCDIPTLGQSTQEELTASQIGEAIIDDQCLDNCYLTVEAGSDEDAYQVRQNKHLPIATLELDAESIKEWEDKVGETFASIFQLKGASKHIQPISKNSLIDRYKFKFKK